MFLRMKWRERKCSKKSGGWKCRLLLCFERNVGKGVLSHGLFAKGWRDGGEERRLLEKVFGSGALGYLYLTSLIHPNLRALFGYLGTYVPRYPYPVKTGPQLSAADGYTYIGQ